MAESTFHLRILSADRTFYSGECCSLTAPAITGQWGILPHHSNMIAAIVPGELKARFPDGTTQAAAVSGGLLKIEDNDVLVLVDTAERPDEIDENRAKRAESLAKEEMLQKKTLLEYRAAQASLSRALNRLKVRKSHGL